MEIPKTVPVSLPGIETHGLNCIAFDPQGRYLVAAGGTMVRGKALREVISWSLPEFGVRWHTVEDAESRIAHLAMSPDGQEFFTHCTESHATVWDADGQMAKRTISIGISRGNAVYAADGRTFAIPTDNKVTVRGNAKGRIATSYTLDLGDYTSAETVAFLPGAGKLVAGCSVIKANGTISGLIVLLNLENGRIERKTPVEIAPIGMTMDPEGRWLCVVGRRKSRGYVLFWDPIEWKQIAGGSAHGGGIEGVAAAPDGVLAATCGHDNIVRLWSTGTWKTVVKLDAHGCEGSGTSGVAWSPDGAYLAYANSAGLNQLGGGVFVYRRGNSDRQWQLIAPCLRQTSADELQRPRHIRVFGSRGEMDTSGNFDVPVNALPEKCSLCTFLDIDSVPQPYLLRRGVTAPGDFAVAQLGNFFVREKARKVIEVAAPGSCKFYATVHYKTGDVTDWFLAVPRTQVETAKLADGTVRCKACHEPKISCRFDELQYEPPAADIFKSKQWIGSQTAENAKWYWMHILKVKKPPKARKNQWTRIDMDRELWFSVRLSLLFKELRIKGFPYRSLEQRRPRDAESVWIAAQMEKLTSGRGGAKTEERGTTKATGAHSPSAAKWLTRFIAANTSTRPLSNISSLRAWTKKHDILLPKDYQRYATKVGRKKFRDLMGLEGLDVRIVGPNQFDVESLRRDPPDDPADEAEPDGLMFAIAINGDCLCFDLRSPATDYPVFCYDHEAKTFTPFAGNFAAAVHRLASGE